MKVNHCFLNITASDYRHKKIKISSLFVAGLSLFAGLTSIQAQAQTCPAGSVAGQFDWSTSPGTGNEWLSSNDTTGDFQVYSVPYTDGGGNPQTMNVTVTLQDPDAINNDDNLVCFPQIGPSPCDSFQTETNGAYVSCPLSLYQI